MESFGQRRPVAFISGCDGRHTVPAEFSLNSGSLFPAYRIQGK